MNEDKPRQIEGTVAEIKDAPTGSSRGSADDESGGVKDQKTIVVYIPGNDLKGGESANVSWKQPFQEQGLVISTYNR